MVHELDKLNWYIEKCGSTYAATIFIGRKARQLAESYDNVISHAEAISWLLSGRVPDNVKHYSERICQREQRVLLYAKEYLASIKDIKVRDSVLRSLELSRKAGHLIYMYEEVYDPDRKARVRVLTNKLWWEGQGLDDL